MIRDLFVNITISIRKRFFHRFGRIYYFHITVEPCVRLSTVPDARLNCYIIIGKSTASGDVSAGIAYDGRKMKNYIKKIKISVDI